MQRTEDLLACLICRVLNISEKLQGMALLAANQRFLRALWGLKWVFVVSREEGSRQSLCRPGNLIVCSIVMFFLAAAAAMPFVLERSLVQISLALLHS